MLSNEHQSLVKLCKRHVTHGLATVAEAIEHLRSGGVVVNDFIRDELQTCSPGVALEMLEQVEDC